LGLGLGKGSGGLGKGKSKGLKRHMYVTETKKRASTNVTHRKVQRDTIYGVTKGDIRYVHVRAWHICETFPKATQIGLWQIVRCLSHARATM
jgi:hypothetical protein